MSSWSEQKKFVSVDGRRMAYVEMGSGRPIVFQHGNPTSSYLWRNILPKLADLGRCIAIDLIGMGDSDKLPDSGPSRYTFAEQSHYLDGAFTALGVEQDIVGVIDEAVAALTEKAADLPADKSISNAERACHRVSSYSARKFPRSTRH